MKPAAPGGTGSEHAARWMLPALLLLTTFIVLAWSHVRLLDQDEVFVLQTDSVPTAHALIDVQRHDPISLDPLFYHLVAHASVRLLGPTALAVRLPSLAGYLLMQWCLFRIGLAMSGERAGLLAAVVPLLTATLFYGVQARPYGILLGLSGLVLLSWVCAVRRAQGNRTGWLVMLAVSLALALNTHYFAVLLLIPLCGAELFRTLRTRRADWRLAGAIVAGFAGIGFALPFQRAAGEFRPHYYNAGTVGLHAVTQSYRALFLNYTDYSMRVQHLVAAALVLSAVALLVALWRSLRLHALTMTADEEVYLLLLAALPLAGFVLARFVTHSIEVRYVLPAIVALALLIATALQPERWSVRGYGAAMTGLLLMGAVAGAGRVYEEREKSIAKLASLNLPAEVRERLLATTDARLYVQNLGDFEEDLNYIADPAIQSRMTLLYSPAEELRWLQHDTAALTALHLQHFTRVPAVRYEDLKQQPGEHVLLLHHGGGWNWIDAALAEDHAHVERFGSALGGDVAAVRFVERKP